MRPDVKVQVLAAASAHAALAAKPAARDLVRTVRTALRPRGAPETLSAAISSAA